MTSAVRKLDLGRRIGLNSLAGRLAVAGVTWIALWALALLLLFDVLLAHVLSGQVDVLLRARAEAVAATVTYTDGRIVTAPGDDSALDAGTSIFLGSTLVEGSQLDPELRGELLQRGQRSTDRESFGPVRYLAKPIEADGRQVGTIVVSSATGDQSRTQKILLGASVGFIVALLVVTFFALRAALTRALRPVRAMADQASEWSADDVSRRFNPDVGPWELRQLAHPLNGLLERIAATLRHERRFTAELAHEVRTPLAHLRAELDLLTAAADDPARREPVTLDGLGKLRQSVARLETLVESALAPARAELGGNVGTAPMAEVLRNLPTPTSGTALAINGADDVVLAVEQDVARRAVLPVLENAYRYAATTVTIEVSSAGGEASIAISDDGGRLSADDAERIFEPGFRADPADGHPGAGLGLALTRRICRSAGGDAEATVEPGRTTVTLRLPCL